MATLTSAKTGGSHWYTPDGEAAHKIPAKSGGDKSPTIKDAQNLGLLPSVTSILSVIAKPGLDTWGKQQVAIAASKNPIQPGEEEKSYANRCIDIAFQQVVDAADLGSRIHGALEAALQGAQFDPDLKVYVDPVLAWFAEKELKVDQLEAVLTSPEEGYAGTTDLLFRYGKKGYGIIDYKTLKTKPGEKVTAYDGQAMQLAAYAAIYYGVQALDKVLAANVYISTTEPGRFDVVKHEDLGKHYRAFLAARDLWVYLRGYDPRRKVGPIPFM